MPGTRTISALYYWKVPYARKYDKEVSDNTLIRGEACWEQVTKDFLAYQGAFSSLEGWARYFVENKTVTVRVF